MRKGGATLLSGVADQMMDLPQPLRGWRVLIVEDEYLLADDLAQALRKSGAEPVGPAATIDQAGQLMQAGGFDAAILDLNLRGAMASGLIEKMSRDHVPCLIVSGYSEEALPTSLRNFARLEKPTSSERVIEKLAEVLSEPPGTRN